jgi:hypothetical protein
MFPGSISLSRAWSRRKLAPSAPCSASKSSGTPVQSLRSRPYLAGPLHPCLLLFTSTSSPEGSPVVSCQFTLLTTLRCNASASRPQSLPLRQPITTAFPQSVVVRFRCRLSLALQFTSVSFHPSQLSQLSQSRPVSEPSSVSPPHLICLSSHNGISTHSRNLARSCSCWNQRYPSNPPIIARLTPKRRIRENNTYPLPIGTVDKRDKEKIKNYKTPLAGSLGLRSTDNHRPLPRNLNLPTVRPFAFRTLSSPRPSPRP